MAARWWQRRGHPGTAVAVVGAFLLLLGSSVAGLVLAAQRHAPRPTAAQTGTLGGAATASGLVLPASPPVSIAIPSIGMAAPVNRAGRDGHGAVEVPPPDDGAVTDEPAWYTGSPAPGQAGASVILGHVDSARYGPADFFALGALQPGDEIDVTRRDGTTAVFTVDGVRSYLPSAFPERAVFGAVRDAALRLVTCGRRFGAASHRRSIVVYASLQSAHPAG